MLPKAILFALAALITSAAVPDHAHAAPVIETSAAREIACTAGSLAPECLAVSSLDAAGSAFGLLKAGGLLLGSAAATAIQASESIMPVPLPAAGWLLLAGLGGLGLFGRRRQGALPTLRRARDGVEPIATTLRGGVRGDAPAPLRTPPLIPGSGLSDRLRDLMHAGEGLRAFAPGRASPDRPCGGAGMLWAATAERAPPTAVAVERAAGVLPRAVRHGRAFGGLDDVSARLQDWVSGLAARFLFACDASLAATVLRPAPVLVRHATGNRNGSVPSPCVSVRAAHGATVLSILNLKWSSEREKS